MVVESGRFDWSQGGKFPSLTEPEPAYHGLKFFENFGDFAFTTKARAVALRDFGPTLSPMNAFLTITGIETLHLRMDRHVENAKKVAEFLAQHPAVAWVSYAGLRAAPITRWRGNTCRKGRARSSPSASRAATRPASSWSRASAVLASRQYRRHPQPDPAPGLDDAPAALRRAALAAGAGPDVVRLSIGLETAEDLIRDLDEALDPRTRGEGEPGGTM
jgi:O-acetylhomoserine (thiol)-lyase